MRFRWLAALGVALGLVAGSGSASAITLTVSGGNGLDQGQLCVSGSLCPGTPLFTLIGTAPATGSFSYDPVGMTASFTLTLTADANFGGELIQAGSTFQAAGVPVLSTPLGGGAIEIFQSGSATGLASPSYPIRPAAPSRTHRP